ncbi:MAG: hypothetical protein WA254_09035 [Candidatus Sulfotelmatobacter sp.]
MSDRSDEDAGLVDEATYFFIGKDSFADLVFNPARQPGLRHIFNKAKQASVKEFVLAEKPQVKYLCHVTLHRVAGQIHAPAGLLDT